MPLEDRDHRVSLDAAATITRSFRGAPPPLARGGAFHADQVRELLDQKGCVALRIYNGKGADGRHTFVLVGVDEKDHDMTDGILLNFSYPCPPFCGDGSALNS